MDQERIIQKQYLEQHSEALRIGKAVENILNGFNEKLNEKIDNGILGGGSFRVDHHDIFVAPNGLHES
jgi:F0F1-type ATP synthase delta subunit